MEAAIELHELAEMRLALPPRPMGRPFTRATPPARGPHPLAPRPAVLLPHERQHPLAFGRGPRMIRGAPCAAVRQPLRAFRPIAPRQPLRLAIAHAQQRCRRTEM